MQLNKLGLVECSVRSASISELILAEQLFKSGHGIYESEIRSYSCHVLACTLLAVGKSRYAICSLCLFFLIGCMCTLVFLIRCI